MAVAVLVDVVEAEAGWRIGRGPKAIRDTPDVLSRGMCLLRFKVLLRKSGLLCVLEMSDALSSSSRLGVEAPAPRCFFPRMATVAAIPPMPPLKRGDCLGGVCAGPAGSLERAEWTRASSFCICAVRVRIWVRELDGGILCTGARGLSAALAAEGLDEGVRTIG